MPNPGYNPERAKEYIREVFSAVIAHDRRRGYLNTKKAAQLQEAEEGFTVEGFMEERIPREVMPVGLRKWFTFSEIGELYTRDDGTKTVLEDKSPETPLNLKDEAVRICNEERWDIYTEDGQLLYKHGL